MELVYSLITVAVIIVAILTTFLTYWIVRGIRSIQRWRVI